MNEIGIALCLKASEGTGEVWKELLFAVRSSHLDQHPVLILCSYSACFWILSTSAVPRVLVINLTKPLNPWVPFVYDSSSSGVWSTWVLSAHLEQIWEELGSAGMRTGFEGRWWWNLLLAHEAELSKLLHLSVSFFSPRKWRGKDVSLPTSRMGGGQTFY